MRKAVTVAAVAGWLAAACPTTQALADDELVRRIEDRPAHISHGQSSNDPINMLVNRILQCWNVPPELANAHVRVTVRISLNRDGSLAAPPVVTNRSQHPLFGKAAESAIRAMRTCAPFTFLPAAKYEQWKTIVVDFDPRSIMR